MIAMEFTIPQEKALKKVLAVNEARTQDALAAEPTPGEPIVPPVTKATPVQSVLIVLATITFLYFARPVILPLILACVGAMTLKPLIRWLSYCRIPPAVSAAVVLCLLVSAIGI